MTSPTAYDPPIELEGENMGLVETVAARLWAKRSAMFGPRATPRDFERQSAQVKSAWRKTAEDVLQLLLVDLAFQGPAGPPRIPDTDWTYCWHGDCDSWEIVDENSGAVALVMHHQDLQMLVAAPRMAAAIRRLQAQLAGSPVLDHPAIQDLIASLPSPPTNPAKD